MTHARSSKPRWSLSARLSSAKVYCFNRTRELLCQRRDGGGWRHFRGSCGCSPRYWGVRRGKIRYEMNEIARVGIKNNKVVILAECGLVLF